MPFARSVSAVTTALLLVGCAASSSAGASNSGADHRRPHRSTPAKQAVTIPTPTAGEAASTTARHRKRPLTYTFPVHGCSASPSSSHHDYPASDIFTQPGCEFVAVVRGRVDEVSYRDRWNPSVDAGATRGGLSVSIIGDDGVRYYGSHLRRIAHGIEPGARVRRGQLLGRVGNTGDAKYTPTHVHFGISWPTHQSKWWVRRGEVWPQRYLTAWRAGDDLSPAREVRRTHRRVGNVPHCTVLC